MDEAIREAQLQSERAKAAAFLATNIAKYFNFGPDYTDDHSGERTQRDSDRAAQRIEWRERGGF